MPKSRRFVLLSIAVAACLLGKDTFAPGAAADYPHQVSENVTIGAQPFDTPALQRQAFSKKVNFSNYGVLPVLVVIENHRKTSLDVSSIQANLVASDGRHAEATPPQDLFGLGTPHGARTGAQQIPLPIPTPKKKNPFNDPSVIDLAFSARFVAPGQSVSGFFYFQAQLEPGDHIYLDGLQDAQSRKDLLYFEFPITGDK